MIRPGLLCVAALLALAACKSEPAQEPVREHLIAQLSDGRDPVRAEAVRQLGKGANRTEAAALARAAGSSTPGVRREIALALGEAAAPEAVDHLGMLTHDPADEVRAAAVASLGRSSHPRARPYVLAAYAKGGPVTRAAVAHLGTQVLTDSIAHEARLRRERALTPQGSRGCCLTREAGSDCRLCAPAVRAQSLRELGLHGTPDAVAQLAARLADDESVVVAGAAEGLALAGAADQAPLLAAVLRSGSPLVVEAAARALGELGAKETSDALVAAALLAEGDAALALFEALGELGVTPAGRKELCALAAKHNDPAIAVAAWRLASPDCVLAPPELGPRAPPPAGEGARLAVLAAAGVRSEPWRARARQVLASEDPALAIQAAAYLGVAGQPADGAALLAAASRELDAIVGARLGERQRREARLEAFAEEDASHYRLLEALGRDPNELLNPPNRTLQDLLRARRPASEATPLEYRPGAVELVATAALAAARLGADAGALGARLLQDEDPRLRRGAVAVAEVMGASARTLRALLEEDTDREVERARALADFASGREGAFLRLLQLARLGNADARLDAARALSPHAGEAVDAFLELARGGDSAASVALLALREVDDPRVVPIAGAKLGEAGSAHALEAVAALTGNSDPKADELLSIAAVSPSGVVRYAALTAMAVRGRCPERVGALLGDFEARVRRAAAEAQRACAAAER